MLVDQQPQARLEHLVAGDEPRHRLADPAHQAVMRQHEGIVAGQHDARGARLDLAAKRLHRRAAFRALASGPPAFGSGREAETLQHARHAGPRRARRPSW